MWAGTARPKPREMPRQNRHKKRGGLPRPQVLKDGGGAQLGGTVWNPLARRRAESGDLVSRGEAPAWDPGADLGSVAGLERPQKGWGFPTDVSPSPWHGPFLVHSHGRDAEAQTLGQCPGSCSQGQSGAAAQLRGRACPRSPCCPVLLQLLCNIVLLGPLPSTSAAPSACSPLLNQEFNS